MVPPEQLGYLRAICASAQKAAQRARADAAAAEQALADAVELDLGPAQLQAVWQLQRQALEKLHIGLFFTRLYVAAARA